MIWADAANTPGDNPCLYAIGSLLVLGLVCSSVVVAVISLMAERRMKKRIAQSVDAAAEVGAQLEECQCQNAQLQAQEAELQRQITALEEATWELEENLERAKGGYYEKELEYRIQQEREEEERQRREAEVKAAEKERKRIEESKRLKVLQCLHCGMAVPPYLHACAKDQCNGWYAGALLRRKAILAEQASDYAVLREQRRQIPDDWSSYDWGERLRKEISQRSNSQALELKSLPEFLLAEAEEETRTGPNLHVPPDVRLAVRPKGSTRERFERALEHSDFPGIGRLILEVLLRPDQHFQPDEHTVFLAGTVPLALAAHLGVPVSLTLPSRFRDVHLPEPMRDVWTADGYFHLIILAFLFGADRVNLPPPHDRLVLFYKSAAQEEEKILRQAVEDYRNRPKPDPVDRKLSEIEAVLRNSDVDAESKLRAIAARTEKSNGQLPTMGMHNPEDL